MQSYKKIVDGYVIQKYEEGVPVSQEFIAGDVSYEDADGEPIDAETDNEQYLPFDMVQPERIKGE